MSYFATEFPVSLDVSQKKFAALAIAWARGMQDSELFSSACDSEQTEDHAQILAPNGETLTLKQCELATGFVSGVRYEKPDKDGLTWRSEIVLTKIGDRAIVRAKTQCLSFSGSAKPYMPRKPYMVKMAIDDGWTVADHGLPVSDQPILANEEEMKMVAAAINSSSECLLPIIYISKPFDSADELDPDDISKAAFRMGGVAKVVVEVDRSTSSRLMDLTEGQNPYGGTIALISAGTGIVSKLYRGGKLQDNTDVLKAICSKAMSYSSSRQANFGWDWQDLLEESARQLRNKVEDASGELSEWQSLVDQQLQEKDIEIKRLVDTINQLNNELLEETNDDGSLLSLGFSRTFGKQIYDGEFSDRLRYALIELIRLDTAEIDRRTRILVERIAQNTQFSGNSRSLQNRLKAAGRDSKKADDRIMQILTEIGFAKRIDGGHPVMEPSKNLFGFQSQTFSTSPSDHRAGKNKAFQVINGLFLRSISD